MYSLLSRGNALLAYAFTYLAVAATVCFVTTIVPPAAPQIQLTVHQPLVKEQQQYRMLRQRFDRAFFTFDLHVDLTPLFNWNTKEVFLYVTAEYSTSDNPRNQVVVWDRPIMRGYDNPVLKLNDQQLEYAFFDDGNGLKGNKNVTLSLFWNTIPVAGGLLPRFKSGSQSFAFGDYYHG